MALKNKDGTPYKISSPNKIMITQSQWDSYKQHNMSFNKVINKDVKPKTKIEAPKPVEVVTEKIPVFVHKEEPVEEVKTNNLDKYKTICHCLPASFIEKKDDLYGETYKELTYGEPFTFEGFILETHDHSIKIWCMAKVGVRSIVYPKNQEKRWWEITEIAEEKGGYTLSGIISDYNPQMS